MPENRSVRRPARQGLLGWLLGLARLARRNALVAPPAGGRLRPEPARARSGARERADGRGKRPDGQRPDLASTETLADVLPWFVSSVHADHPPPAEVGELAELIRASVRAHGASVPPFPAVASRVLELAQQADADINEIIGLVHQEPATAARVLAIANSAAFGGRRLEGIRDAVLRLGVREVARVTMAVAGRAVYEGAARRELALFEAEWKRLYADSLVTAFAAGWLAQELKLHGSDGAFVGGVLFSAGRSMALRAVGVSLLDGSIATRPSPEVLDWALDLVERELIEAALTSWALPDSLQAVLGAASGPGTPVRHAVHLVAMLVVLRDKARHTQERVEVARASAEALQLDGRWLRVAMRQLEESVAQVHALFPELRAGRVE